MTTIYYERDGDVAAIAGERVVVVGYGNQGRSWALNLRDSGCEPVICVRRDATREQAEADGFEAHDVEAASDGDIICILVPDDVVPLLPIEPSATSCVIVASGYTLAFDRLQPPGDVGMVAPRMLGPEVRLCYEEGVGFITAVGVHRDVTGRAQERVLAIARAIGGLRQGGIELTPMQEAVLDLGVEQVLSPALGGGEQRLRAHDARARHSHRGDRHRAGVVGRGGAHVPADARGRVRDPVGVPFADVAVRPAHAAGELRPPRLPPEDARVGRRHRERSLRRRVGRRA